MLGIMAAEYLRNKEKRTNEKFVRELVELANTPDQWQMAEQWAYEHGVDIDDLRDDSGRRYRRVYRRRPRRRLRTQTT